MTMETERLLLRPPTLADVPALFAFLGDPQAMRHTHLDSSLRQCRRRIAAHERRRRRNGYAPWTVVCRQDNSIIGWGGIYEDPFYPGWGVEVGYSFHPRTWAQGYATELVAACTRLADGVLDLPEVVAYVREENAGSRRVLEKTGFRYLRPVPQIGRLQYSRRRGGE